MPCCRQNSCRVKPLSRHWRTRVNMYSLRSLISIIFGRKTTVDQLLRKYVLGRRIRQRDCRCKCMPGAMEREQFINAADIGYFLEVSIHLLVGQYRQERSFVIAFGMVGIFFNNMA